MPYFLLNNSRSNLGQHFSTFLMWWLQIGSIFFAAYLIVSWWPYIDLRIKFIDVFVSNSRILHAILENLNNLEVSKPSTRREITFYVYVVNLKKWRVTNFLEGGKILNVPLVVKVLTLDRLKRKGQRVVNYGLNVYTP